MIIIILLHQILYFRFHGVRSFLYSCYNHRRRFHHGNSHYHRDNSRHYNDRHYYQ